MPPAKTPHCTWGVWRLMTIAACWSLPLLLLVLLSFAFGWQLRSLAAQPPLLLYPTGECRMPTTAPWLFKRFATCQAQAFGRVVTILFCPQPGLPKPVHPGLPLASRLRRLAPKLRASQLVFYAACGRIADRTLFRVFSSMDML